MKNTRRFTHLARRGLALFMVAACMLAAGCARTEDISAFSYPREGTFGGGSLYASNAQTIDPYADITLGVVAQAYAATDPINANERDIVSLNALIFESLVELDDALRPTPLLADRWVKDGKTWTFTLRSGIFFHNGQTLTAYDVVASYQAIMAAGAANPYVPALSTYVDQMTVLPEDAMTLRVVGKNSSYMLLYAMTFPVVQSAYFTSGGFGTQPMGTGPFWCTQSNLSLGMRLERNPHWWKRAPGVERISVYRYQDAEALIEGFETGQVHMIATRSSAISLSDRLSDRDARDYTTNTYEMLVPNLSNDYLSELDTRRALMYAIDRDTLAEIVYLDMVQKSEVPVPPGSWLYEAQSTRYNYNPELAYKILIDAGWSDSDGDSVLDRVKGNMMQKLELKLITYNEPLRATRHEAALLIAEQLARIGVSVTVELVSKSNMRAALRDGAFDIALVANELSATPDLYFMLAADGSGNMSGYQSDIMDNHLTAARMAASEDQLKAALSKVQMQVVDELPVMGLFFRSGMLISRKGLSGMSGLRESQMLRGFEFLGTQ